MLCFRGSQRENSQNHSCICFSCTNRKLGKPSANWANPPFNSGLLSYFHVAAWIRKTHPLQNETVRAFSDIAKISKCSLPIFFNVTKILCVQIRQLLKRHIEITENQQKNVNNNLRTPSTSPRSVHVKSMIPPPLLEPYFLSWTEAGKLQS